MARQRAWPRETAESTQNGHVGSDRTWLFVYGPAIPAHHLCGIIGGPLPTQSLSAIAQDAWLSFDARGTPYFEPARSSLIIQGLNDHEAPTAGSDNAKSVAYRKWIHDRCSPGIDNTGGLPPCVEGMAYLVTPIQLLAWQVHHATFGHLSLPTSPRLVPINLHSIKYAKDERIVGVSERSFVAHTLVAPSANRAPNLQPTWMTLMLHSLALLMPCSKSYVAYVTGIRPYRADHTMAKVVVGMFLLPAFAVCYAPFALFKRPIPLVCARILEMAISASWTLERWISPWLGSGCVDL